MRSARDLRSVLMLEASEFAEGRLWDTGERKNFQRFYVVRQKGWRSTFAEMGTEFGSITRTLISSVMFHC